MLFILVVDGFFDLLKLFGQPQEGADSSTGLEFVYFIGKLYNATSKSLEVGVLLLRVYLRE